MHRNWAWVVVAFLLASSVGAKEASPKFKSVEVKHFSRAEGVELSPQFPDFLYAELREQLQKSKMFEQILGEDEAVDPSEANQSLIVEGSVLEYRKGSKAKEYLVGFGAGRRSLTTQVKVLRRSNNESLLAKELKVKATSFRDEKLLAKFLAQKIAGEVKRSLGR